MIRCEISGAKGLVWPDPHLAASGKCVLQAVALVYVDRLRHYGQLVRPTHWRSKKWMQKFNAAQD